MFIPAATQTHTKTKAMRERSHARANTIALTHGIFPIQPDRRTSPSTLPPLLFLYVASSGAAGTIELTHALFPLPALCFPYGNPLCVPGAGSGSEGSPTEQNNTTKTALGYSKELWVTDRNIKLETAKPRVLPELTLIPSRQFGFYTAPRDGSECRPNHGGMWRCVSERVLPGKRLHPLTKRPVWRRTGASCSGPSGTHTRWLLYR